uniref:Calmodulin n=1 Tax=Florenciella parvula TaxID=236787 RepID=A0A7S2FH26_9STRA|mmetsp:Transcript_16306/g.34044  ORF Transcript_16306/g.34044 Transcript_16306/m.34044 type:complete len:189 (+) Transcript_16306:182-748(+)|eukprot:CAMPEP_0119478828 /NCGR_PEP_ID=MMETSP1344-20130328/8384_1 /TAXON_ID=236787 /ORGANISM="Florenciella parvula, Strain CCMP2471" /LENGTH=188 /DNA_ID=CAMNT_0007513027 /DNA_START=190 /DNA_END=756 /DNA_ORIENTATION=-
MSEILSPEEVIELKATFKYFAGKNGKVKDKDVGKMFRAAGCGPTSHELEKYMLIMDDEASGFITEQPFLELMTTLRHPKEPTARLRAVYDVLAKGRQKKKKKAFNPLEAMSAKEEDLSFMAEKDWARLIERLRITHLFDNWQRAGGEDDGELNEESLTQIRNMLREFDEDGGPTQEMQFPEFCMMMLF